MTRRRQANQDGEEEHGETAAGEEHKEQVEKDTYNSKVTYI